VEYKYYLAQLDKEEARLYSFVYSQINARTNSFYVKASVDSIHKIIKSILLDNPELYWFEGKWNGEKENDGIRVFPKYKARENYQEIHISIENTVDEISQRCKGAEVERIHFVYDWIIQNIQYSYSDNDQTIEGALVEKRAVCKGIAKAFQLMMNCLAIPSYLIEGTIDGLIPHIWNVVYVNNCFYHVDVTMGYEMFAHLFVGLNRNKHYPCFLVSDKTVAETHRMYSGNFPPSSYDFDFDAFLTEYFCIPTELSKYGKLKYLDKGSTCTVFGAVHLNSMYVLKVVAAHNNLEMFRGACLELEKLQMLDDCPGVTKLVDSVVSENHLTVYMLMYYYKPLTIRRKEPGFDSVKHTLCLGVDLLNAMINCRNKGIYHLDIQPKNIYFDKNDKAVLGDFSCAVLDKELKSLKPKRGTLAFMAPEVYYAGDYGQVSEIYSLGIVLYSLLNNAKLPFVDGNNLNVATRIRLDGTELPRPCHCETDIWKCIRKMCVFNPSDRYQTYEDVKEDLERIFYKHYKKQPGEI